VTHRDFYDVVVVGAGAAGVAAAAAAAFSGASAVALIESSDRIGGAVTGAMHRSLCGLYAAEPWNAVDTLNDGIQRQIVSRMLRSAPDNVIPRSVGQTWVLEFPQNVWETALFDVLALNNLDRLMGCKVAGVDRKKDVIIAVHVQGTTNCQLGLRVLIDCTGGGHVIRMCGKDAALPDDPRDRMLGGYSIRLSGIDGDPEMLRIQTPYVLTRAVSEEKLPREARFTLFVPGTSPGEGFCKLAVSPDHFAQEEVELFANAVLEHLKQSLPAFAGARVVESSPRAYARDGTRLRGKYVVSEQDVLGAKHHAGQTAHAWWPIEFWDRESGPTYSYPPQGQHYDIPADALHSAVIPNLLAAGTCVSATPKAAASLRASGICLATGDLAGQLAASLLSDM
jgi:2-polyprenyl-6-methoxyphenol hydroxylase-like FAD-dependent oxidoreductase